jgi:hypothetical protein
MPDQKAAEISAVLDAYADDGSDWIGLQWLLRNNTRTSPTFQPNVAYTRAITMERPANRDPGEHWRDHLKALRSIVARMKPDDPIFGRDGEGWFRGEDRWNENPF